MTTALISEELALAVRGLQAVLEPGYIESVAKAAELLSLAFEAKGKLLICGNGGSAADAQHIAAELVGRYKIERRGLPAISLATDSSVLTAWSNDYSYTTVFSRQVEALAVAGDVVWGISTSGNSPNVVEAFRAAKKLGCKTLAFAGRDGGELAKLADVAVVVPLSDTARIQEAHLMSYHVLCSCLDARFAGSN